MSSAELPSISWEKLLNSPLCAILAPQAYTRTPTHGNGGTIWTRQAGVDLNAAAAPPIFGGSSAALYLDVVKTLSSVQEEVNRKKRQHQQREHHHQQSKVAQPS
jgi:hypothetical protein